MALDTPHNHHETPMQLVPFDGSLHNGRISKFI